MSSSYMPSLNPSKIFTYDTRKTVTLEYLCTKKNKTDK